ALTTERLTSPARLSFPTRRSSDLTSHVVPAMIRKCHEAKENGHQPVELWGTGSPRREFLYVHDLAEAVLFSYENNLEKSMYNIRSEEHTSELQSRFVIVCRLLL